jgi:hypothetical protein
MADNFQNEVATIHRSQKVLENTVPLHVDIPRTGESGPDLPFEAVLQEYLQFPALLAVKHNAVKRSTKLTTSLNSKHYRPYGILIHR